MIDIYAHLSRPVNGERIEAETQIELCAGEILARDAEVGESFRDISLSAWDPTVKPPDWNRLMERLESDASDGVMSMSSTGAPGWDQTVKRWYDPRPPTAGLDRWVARPPLPDLLPGEDCVRSRCSASPAAPTRTLPICAPSPG